MHLKWKNKAGDEEAEAEGTVVVIEATLEALEEIETEAALEERILEELEDSCGEIKWAWNQNRFCAGCVNLRRFGEPSYGCWLQQSGWSCNNYPAAAPPDPRVEAIIPWKARDLAQKQRAISLTFLAAS